MTATRVIGVVVDTKLLTVYRADGTTVEVPQGDPRVPQIIDALPKIEQQGFAMIDLDASNPYRDFEQKSGGLVRFFKVAKSKVAGLFGGGEEVPTVTPRAVGHIPGSGITETQTAEKQPFSHAEAVDEIMKNAEPIGQVSATEIDPDIDEQHTVVAVTEGKAIPHQEKMKEHIRHHGGKIGSVVGMQNFYRRITPIIEKRGHSVEDLLRFMEKNDLPIADDGCLIVYKVLRRSKKNKEGFVDCHTQNVEQRIGSFVCVDESLVDKNRRNECSNGLHVARRGYIGGFSGDVCTISKVAPEDVMTVPHGDPNKVRVCGYHLIMALENDAWQLLKNNRPMTENPKAQKMLARAISGDHIGRIEIVKIGGGHGTNVTITPIEQSQQKNAPKPKVEPAKALDHDQKDQVDSARTEAQAKAIIQTGSATQALSRQDQAKAYLDTVNSNAAEAVRVDVAQKLIQMKRAAKVSWATLGIGEANSKKILELSAIQLPKEVEESVTVMETPPTAVAPAIPATPKKKAVQKAKKTKTKVVKTKAPVEQPAATDAPAVEPTKPTAKSTTGPIKSESMKVRVLNLIELLSSGSTKEIRVNAARELLAIRKKVKKTWAALGYPEMMDDGLRTTINTDGREGPYAIKEEPKKETSPPASGRNSRARELFLNKEWTNLLLFKKKAKVSWEKLGFSDKEITEIKLHSGD